jgi:hypothetical protein
LKYIYKKPQLVDFTRNLAHGLDCAGGSTANNNCISNGPSAQNHSCDNGGLVGCVSTGGGN